MRDPRYDILFEPMQIGPLTAKNRFYQVPHCNGGGYRDPSAAAAMRGIKSEGGWGVIFTEQCEMHHTSEITPFIELRLWEDKDIPQLAKMAGKMKEHGALAGIQLAYSGINGPNLYTKEVPLAPSALPIRTFTNDPVQARALDKQDIRDLRRWFVNAAKRSQMAGFDLICLYGAHGFGIFQHFLSRATNHRSDEYGGSLENRSRFAREVIEDMREAVGETMALTLRVSLDETIGELGFSNAEVRDFIEMNRDLPDLWDLAQGTWEDCSGPSRFKEEAAQESLVRGIKELSDKPVVGVGRFTSPDVMAKMIRTGTLDFIGCARPSIADPFLPKKVEEGRIEDIRECIGCNICITGDMTMSISRCTQNPTFMEEWRKGWHPEKMNTKGGSDNVLVVGSGPAGLEAARVCATRGHKVTVFEAAAQLGGQLILAAKPSLYKQIWGIADWLISEVNRLGVTIHLNSYADCAQVVESKPDTVIIASGGLPNLQHDASVEALAVSPWDVLGGYVSPKASALIYDDQGAQQALSAALYLAEAGTSVCIVTPDRAPLWELGPVTASVALRELYRRSVTFLPDHEVAGAAQEGAKTVVQLRNVLTGDLTHRDTDHLVIDQGLLPMDELFEELRPLSLNDGVTDPNALAENRAQPAAGDADGEFHLYRVGDAIANRGLHAAIYDALRLCIHL